MAASIEARMPFLDHELAAFVSAFPDAWRVRGFTTKRILRLAMRRLLPRTNSATAQGRVPGAGQRVVPHLDAGLSARTPDGHRTRAPAPTTDPQELRRVLQEHFAGRHNHEKLLWCLLNLEIWQREYTL